MPSIQQSLNHLMATISGGMVAASHIAKSKNLPPVSGPSKEKPSPWIPAIDFKLEVPEQNRIQRREIERSLQEGSTDQIEGNTMQTALLSSGKDALSRQIALLTERREVQDAFKNRMDSIKDPKRTLAQGALSRLKEFGGKSDGEE